MPASTEQRAEAYAMGELKRIASELGRPSADVPLSMAWDAIASAFKIGYAAGAVDAVRRGRTVK